MIHMHENSASTSNFLKITNSFTGETSGDRLDIGVEGTGDAIFWIKENRALKVATSNSARMTILNDGKVGIGTIAPINNLEVMGDASNGVAGFTRSDLGGNKSHILHGATGDWYLRPSLSTGKVIIADNGDKVGIGTDSPDALLDVNGDIKTSGEIHRPATGSANLLPICFGMIDTDDATIIGGTGNFQIIDSDPATCWVVISIDNVFFSEDNGSFVVLVTPQDGGYAWYSSTTIGDLVIYSTDDLFNCHNFSFLVYQL
jgi:hypothetical protein